MIKVIIDDYMLDLSNEALNIVEKNNIFRDNITKTYSLPFYLQLTEDIAVAFGMVSVKNITNYSTNIAVKVLVNNNYYDGTLKISQIVDLKATITLYYGSETLAVYSKNLKELPFEIVKTASITMFAQKQNEIAWPNATHNYVTIYNDEIQKKTNYENFEGFLNQTSAGYYLTNYEQTVDDEIIYYNKNVLAPMPYLMEMLRVGYAEESLTMKGSFVDDSFNHKIVHIPDTYLEKFSVLQYEIYSFATNTYKYLSNNKVVSEYSKTHSLTSIGSYNLKIGLHLNEMLADDFDLQIKHGSALIYEAKSSRAPIDIEEQLTINRSSASDATELKIILKLNEQTESIEAFNLFEFEFQEGKLNVFPNTFALADFMPDCTFKQLVDCVANLFNLDVDIIDNIVYLNYIETSMKDIVFVNHQEFEVENPIRKINTSKAYKLKYANNTEIIIDKTGVIFNNDVDAEDLTTIDLPVIPLEIIENEDKITGKFTADAATLKLCLYNGLVNEEPLAVETINNRSLALTNIYENCWKNWLKFRCNSEVYEDTYFAHVDAVLNITKGISKYKKKHIIKEISKTSINKDYNKVKIISETF